MKAFNSVVRSEATTKTFRFKLGKNGGKREADCSEMENFVSSHLIGALCSIKQPGRLSWRSPEITMSHCHTGFCYKSLITKRGSDDYSIQYRGLQAAWGSLIKKIQLFVYIHFPHSDYFINCPAFISSLPIPPNNQLLYPEQQTHHRSFVDSKDLLSPLKEPLFFDDWAAANFKAINLISDWLAAHQSPYQILRSDPSLLR